MERARRGRRVDAARLVGEQIEADERIIVRGGRGLVLGRRRDVGFSGTTACDRTEARGPHGAMRCAGVGFGLPCASARWAACAAIAEFARICGMVRSHVAWDFRRLRAIGSRLGSGLGSRFGLEVWA